MSNAMTPGPWRWIAQGVGPLDEWGCRTPGEIDPRTFKSDGYAYNPELLGPGNTVVLSAGSGEYVPFHNPADAVAIAAVPDLLAAAGLLHCLVTSPRFATMTVADAVNELERNGQSVMVALLKVERATP